MKKRFFLKIKILFVILGLTVLIGFNGCSKASDKIELKLAHFFPGTHPAESRLIEGWKNAISKATNGKVVITSYPGGTLLKANDIYDGVVKGVADIGLSCFAYTRGRFPVLEAFELPGIIYKNSKVASKVAWEGIQALNPQEVADTKLMMVLATGPGDLFTKKPVRNLNDLKAMEIRATGLSSKALKALGAVPVGMPQPDVYDALSKGTVQGNLSPIEVLKGWRHAEVTKYLTITPFLYNTLFFITMNKEKWNSLPQDIKDAITKVNQSFHEEVAIGLWDIQNEAGLAFAKEKGMEIINLVDQETKKWIKIVEVVQNDFIEAVNKKGLNGKDILEKVKELAEKYNKVY